MGKFVKGKSGNEAGRPPVIKPHKELASAFADCLQSNNNARLKAIIERLVSLAEGGDMNAISLVLSRYAGSVPKSPSEGDTSTDLDITVTFSPPPVGDKAGVDSDMC